MAPRPYRPAAELQGALARGDIDFAVTLAVEVAEERRRPIDLGLALGFLPLIAAQRPREFDAWALRWLGRWISETPGATAERTAEMAGLLADLPAEPQLLETLRRLCAGGGGRSCS